MVPCVVGASAVTECTDDAPPNFVYSSVSRPPCEKPIRSTLAVRVARVTVRTSAARALTESSTGAVAWTWGG